MNVQGKTHTIKIWPDYYDEVDQGRKRFEFRRNDREYEIGDTLMLEEWDPRTQQYTGRKMEPVKITYTLKGVPGLQNNYVILSIVKESQWESKPSLPL